jgi:hypothetical protein
MAQSRETILDSDNPNLGREVSETKRQNSHQLMRDLFSKETLSEEKILIQKDFPQQSEATESYKAIEEKIDLTKRLLSGISINDFKHFLLSQGTSENLVALVDVLTEETTLKTTKKLSPRSRT